MGELSAGSLAASAAALSIRRVSWAATSRSPLMRMSSAEFHSDVVVMQMAWPKIPPTQSGFGMLTVLMVR